MLSSRVLIVLFSGMFLCAGALCTGCNQTSNSSDSGNSVPKYEINRELEEYPSQLSSSEKELAGSMGYDVKALEAVKKYSGSTFSKIDLNAPYQDESRVQIYNGTWKSPEQRLTHFKELAVRFPELRRFVDPIVASLSTQIKSEAEQSKKPQEQLKTKEKPALRFYIPVSAEIRSLCKTAKREPPTAFFSDDSTAEIKAMQTALKPLGYTAYATQTFRGQPFFNSQAEADAFVKSVKPQELAVICQDPAQSRELDFDPAKADPKKFDYGFFFVDVEKLGPTKWRSTIPAHPIVHTLLKTAVLSKIPSNAADGKFQPLLSEGTNGVNYDIDNSKVLERLTEWDRLYGINILSASSDSVGVEFLKLPENLDAFCTELWKFCPDLVDADPEAKDQQTQRLKQEFINELRQTKQVHFWWD